MPARKEHITKEVGDYHVQQSRFEDLSVCNRRQALAGWALAFPFVGSGLANQPISPIRFQYQPTVLPTGGSLTVRDGIPVLQVSGSATEIGSATGQLALKQATGILRYPKSLISLFKLDPLWPVLVGLGTRMADRFPDRFKQEMDALEKASGVDRGSLIAGNTMFDLKNMVLCSGVALSANQSGTGGTLLGRNLDYPPVGDIGQYTLVSVVRQENRYSYAAIGFPGVIGVFSGMNEHGLALAIHEVVDIRAPLRKFNPMGLPYALCYRQVLEQCRTITEAQTFLNSIPRASATNLLMADKNNVAVLEVNPDQVRLIPGQMGVATCTNHYRHPDHIPDDPANPFQSKERLTCLSSRCQKSGLVGLAGIKESLHETNLGSNTLQSMIFDTKSLQLHLAYGPPPSSSGPYTILNLAPLMAK